eukprot:1159058-Pelagomonas_calceolata.AAC.14
MHTGGWARWRRAPLAQGPACMREPWIGAPGDRAVQNCWCSSLGSTSAPLAGLALVSVCISAMDANQHGVSVSRMEWKGMERNVSEMERNVCHLVGLCWVGGMEWI